MQAVFALSGKYDMSGEDCRHVSSRRLCLVFFKMFSFSCLYDALRRVICILKKICIFVNKTNQLNQKQLIMKKFRFIFMTLLAVSCVAFYSCDDEEENDPIEQNGDNNGGKDNDEKEKITVTNYSMQDEGDVVTADFTMVNNEENQSVDVHVVFTFENDICTSATMQMTFENEDMAKAAYDGFIAGNGTKVSKGEKYQLSGKTVYCDMTDEMANLPKSAVMIILDNVKKGDLSSFSGDNSGDGGPSADIVFPEGSTNFTLANPNEDITETEINSVTLNFTQSAAYSYTFVLAMQRYDATTVEPVINDTYVGVVHFNPATGKSADVNFRSVTGRYAYTRDNIVMEFTVVDANTVNVAYSYDGGETNYNMQLTTGSVEGGNEGDGSEDEELSFPEGSTNYTIDDESRITEDGINYAILNLTQQSANSYVFTLALQHLDAASAEPTINDVYIGVVAFGDDGMSNSVTMRSVQGRYANNHDELELSFVIRGSHKIDVNYSYSGTVGYELHFE